MNSKGLSLVELLVATGISMVGIAATIPLLLMFSRIEIKEQTYKSVDVEFENLISTFSEEVDAFAVLSAPPNQAAIPCLFNKSLDCQPDWIAFKGYSTSWDSASGTVVLGDLNSVDDPFDPTHRDGMTILGFPCRTYGTGRCSVRFVLEWRPLCLAACRNPKFYQVQIRLERSNPSALEGVNLAKFQRIITVKVPPIPILKLEMNISTVCALYANKSVSCWGDNASGTLGRGLPSSTPFSATPAPVIGLGGTDALTGILDLVEGFATWCVLFESGQVACWGENQHGAAGIGALPASQGGSAQEFYSAPPDYVVSTDGTSPLTGATRLYGGNHSICAKVGGENQCWGELRENLTICTPERSGITNPGAIRLGAAMAPPFPPIADLFSIPERIRTTAAPCVLPPASSEFFLGFHNQCFLVGNPGKAMCWGVNWHGLLGAVGGSPITMNQNYFIPRVGLSRATPVPGAPADDLDGIVNLDLGSQQAHCAVLADTRVVCWGDNFDGAQVGLLGRGSLAADANQPPGYVLTSAGTPLTGAVEVNMGWYHACARTSSGQVYCWGNNQNGKLGTGNPAANVAFAALVPLPEAARQVVVGLDGTCALTYSRRVFCWGSNNRGQLGLNPATGSAYATANSFTPVEAGGL
ncbi:MAG: hypothetical protein AB7F86_05660 [Bdellovibrionales bacterium]